jgi:hypothetical protein
LVSDQRNKKKDKHGPCFKRMERIINNKVFVAMISVLVVYKLIFPDIKMLAISKSFDWFSYSMSLFCMVVFAAEMIM